MHIYYTLSVINNFLLCKFPLYNVDKSNADSDKNLKVTEQQANCCLFGNTSDNNGI